MIRRENMFNIDYKCKNCSATESKQWYKAIKFGLGLGFLCLRCYSQFQGFKRRTMRKWET